MATIFASMVCSPTRVALLTGRSPLTLGVNAPMERDRGLSVDERLLPEILRDAGYQHDLTDAVVRAVRRLYAQRQPASAESSEEELPR